MAPHVGEMKLLRIESPHVVSFGKAEETEGLPVAVCFSGVNALCKASSIKLLHLEAARRFRLKG